MITEIPLSSDDSVLKEPLANASELAAIAAQFVQARQQGRSLPDFPGQIPANLVTAYQVQDLAIGQWPDRVVGWKVGFIAAERRDESGDERLLGPIFQRALQDATGSNLQFSVFSGGFGAVEAEYVMRLDADVPEGQTEWTPEQAAAVPSTLFVGM
jgi:2-keto-4-pentenoate hydratase